MQSYDDKLQLAEGIANGLVPLHKVSIIHRDLKMPNIIRHCDATPVIIDPGVSNGQNPSGDTGIEAQCSYM